MLVLSVLLPFLLPPLSSRLSLMLAWIPAPTCGKDATRSFPGSPQWLSLTPLELRHLCSLLSVRPQATERWAEVSGSSWEPCDFSGLLDTGPALAWELLVQTV